MQSIHIIISCNGILKVGGCIEIRNSRSSLPSANYCRRHFPNLSLTFQFSSRHFKMGRHPKGYCWYRHQSFIVSSFLVGQKCPPITRSFFSTPSSEKQLCLLANDHFFCNVKFTITRVSCFLPKPLTTTFRRSDPTET